MAGSMSSARSTATDYMNIRTVPAMLSIIFAGASLFQFGGIPDITLAWINAGSGGYTLTANHSVIASMGALLVAFMSSETRDFDYYEDWEKVAIAAGPILIVGQAYISQVNDFILAVGDPLGMQLAFLVSLVSWGVAVQ